MATAPTQQEIEKQIIGKRVVAVSWLPITSPEDAFELRSITLEGGVKLNLWVEDFEEIVVAEIGENKDADVD